MGAPPSSASGLYAMKGAKDGTARNAPEDTESYRRSAKPKGSEARFEDDLVDGDAFADSNEELDRLSGGGGSRHYQEGLGGRPQPSKKRPKVVSPVCCTTCVSSCAVNSRLVGLRPSP